VALQLGVLHEALKAAGVGDDLARRASEEVAAYESQIAALRTDIASLRAYVEGRFSLLNWMQGTIGALVLAILVKQFVH
jgi:hypothetical protein